MIFGNPAFGAQVVEIDPDRRWMAGGHGLNKAFRQMAGEGFNDDIAGLNKRKIRLPAMNLNPAHPLYVQAGIDFRAKAGKGRQRPDCPAPPDGRAR